MGTESTSGHVAAQLFRKWTRAHPENAPSSRRFLSLLTPSSHQGRLSSSIIALDSSCEMVASYRPQSTTTSTHHNASRGTLWLIHHAPGAPRRPPRQIHKQCCVGRHGRLHILGCGLCGTSTQKEFNRKQCMKRLWINVPELFLHWCLPYKGVYVVLLLNLPFVRHIRTNVGFCIHTIIAGHERMAVESIWKEKSIYWIEFFLQEWMLFSQSFTTTIIITQLSRSQFNQLRASQVILFLSKQINSLQESLSSTSHLARQESSLSCPTAQTSNERNQLPLPSPHTNNKRTQTDKQTEVEAMCEIWYFYYEGCGDEIKDKNGIRCVGSC